MVWYFISVYILNRTLHGRSEIRNFSSRVEKYFSALEEKFPISARPCNILYVLLQANSKIIIFWKKRKEKVKGYYKYRSRECIHQLPFKLRWLLCLCFSKNALSCVCKLIFPEFFFILHHFLCQLLKNTP